MMKRCKRILSVLLVCCMLTSLLPVTALATETPTSGICGENLTWELSDEGVLSIRGTGPMYDYECPDMEWYEEFTYPWDAHRRSICTIDIGEGVTHIGNHAFNRTSATTVIIGSTVQTIGDYAFECTKITSVMLPDGVTRIGDYAFNNCTNLQAAAIPESVTYIGEEAFYATQLTGVNLPEQLTRLGSYAFAYTKLNQVKIPAELNNCGYGVFADTLLTSVEIPEGTLAIPNSMFSGCEKLQSVTIPESVLSIGESAFKDCYALTKVFLPEDLLFIGMSAFENCHNMTSINMPNKIREIEAFTFEGCNKLNGIVLPRSLTSIGTNAFYDCTALQYVNMPDTVINIGDWAFKDCKNLVRVEWTDGVAEPGTGGQIHVNAFSGCGKLTSLAIPYGVETVEDAFYGCNSLTSLVLPDSVTSLDISCSAITQLDIPQNAAWVDLYCPALTSLTLPGTVEYFRCSGCTALKSVVLRNGISTIPAYAFANCTELERVTIPDSVTKIEMYGFQNCSDLERLIIPAGVTSIGYDALPLATIDNVVFLGDAPETELLPPDLSRIPPILHYFADASGWINSPHYDSEKETWQGYPLSVFTSDDMYVRSLQPDNGITINGKGTATAHFQITTFLGNPVAGVSLDCQVVRDSDEQELPIHQPLVSDGNGVVSIPLESDTDETYIFTFTKKTEEGTLHHDRHGVSVYVQEFSYSQKWEGALGAGAELGLSAGAGADTPIASFKASLADLSAKGFLGMEFSLEDSYEDGKRTLELGTAFDQKIGVEYDPGGVEATVHRSELELISVSAGASLGTKTGFGLKIEGYNHEDRDDLAQAGAFILQATLVASVSAIAREIIDVLNIYQKGYHNQSSATDAIAAEAGSSLVAVETGQSTGLKDKHQMKFGNGEASLVGSSTLSTDHLNHTQCQTLSYVVDAGGSLVDGLVPKIGGALFSGTTTNSASLSVNYGNGGAAESVTYKRYDGNESDIGWVNTAKEASVSVTYSGDDMETLREYSPTMDDYVGKDRHVLTPVEMLDAVLPAVTCGLVGAAQKENVQKSGVSINIPVGVKAGVSGKVAVNGSFAEELGYVSKDGVVIGSDAYIFSESTITDEEALAAGKKLQTILTEPLDAIWEYIEDSFEEAVDSVKEGVQNGLASLKNEAKNWYGSITSFLTGSVQSYSIITLASLEEPESSAEVSVTLGVPYYIEVYTDAERNELVSEEALADSPLTLTLQYDNAMLAAVGASSDAVINIYRFDEERNVYILEKTSVQDKADQTVTAQITAHGEYILATDNVAPVVTEFTVSNQTALPTISAVIEDFSGIETFSFWLDDGQTPLVTEATLDEYFVKELGLFTYTVQTPLADGEHTAYFQMTDTLGNPNVAPLAFTFTVDASVPVIANVVVPTETVVDPDGFAVTAAVTEETGLSQVFVRAVANTGETRTYAMTPNAEGVWQGTVSAVAGASQMTVTVVAVDLAGNRTESEAQVVVIAVPAEPEGIVLSAVWGDSVKRTALVSIQNYQQSALSGGVICVAYNTEGKMLEYAGEYVGLAGNDAVELELALDCPAEEIAEAYVLLLDVSRGLKPLCEKQQIAP